jgi:hypothetical protein
MIEIEGLPLPLDVIIGFVSIIFFGMILGAVIYLPVAHNDSKIPLEKLSSDLIWDLVPEWFLILIACIFFLVLSFLLVSGMWRM